MGRNNTSAGKTDKDKEKEKERKNAEKNAQSALLQYHAEALPASDVTMGGDVAKVPQSAEKSLSFQYHAEALPASDWTTKGSVNDAPQIGDEGRMPKPSQSTGTGAQESGSREENKQPGVLLNASDARAARQGTKGASAQLPTAERGRSAPPVENPYQGLRSLPDYLEEVGTDYRNEEAGNRYAWTGGAEQGNAGQKSAAWNDPKWTAYRGLMTPEEKRQADSLEGAKERGAYLHSLDLEGRFQQRELSAREEQARSFELGTTGAAKSDSADGRILRDYIEALDRGGIEAAEVSLQNHPLNLDPTRLRQLDRDTELPTLRRYLQAGDLESAAEYYASIEPRLNRRAAAAVEEANRTFGADHILGSAGTSGVLNAFSGVPAAVRTAGHSIRDAVTEEYTLLDPNERSFDAVRAAQTQQTGALERIDTELQDHPYLRQAAKIAYSGTSSAVTNALQLLTANLMGLEGQAASRFVTSAMGVTSGGSAALETLREGRSASDALMTGLAEGAIEALAETLPVSQWVENLGNIRSGRFALTRKNAAKMLAARMEAAASAAFSVKGLPQNRQILWEEETQRSE